MITSSPGLPAGCSPWSPRRPPGCCRRPGRCGFSPGSGTSERTLARAFQAGTGIPFGRWRILLRLQAALPALAGGQPVGNVARRVGYESTSAFVAAFRQETGLTPAAYFHDRDETPAPSR